MKFHRMVPLRRDHPCFWGCPSWLAGRRRRTYSATTVATGTSTADLRTCSAVSYRVQPRSATMSWRLRRSQDTARGSAFVSAATNGRGCNRHRLSRCWRTAKYGRSSADSASFQHVDERLRARSLHLHVQPVEPAAVQGVLAADVSRSPMSARTPMRRRPADLEQARHTQRTVPLLMGERHQRITAGCITARTGTVVVSRRRSPPRTARCCRTPVLRYRRRPRTSEREVEDGERGRLDHGHHSGGPGRCANTDQGLDRTPTWIGVRPNDQR